MDGAKRLGERVLRGEVEEDDLSSFLASLRELTANEDSEVYFGIPELDALVSQPGAPNQVPHGLDRQSESNLWLPDANAGSNLNANASPRHPRPPNEVKKDARGPMLELISSPATHTHFSSSGKTSLMHLITALAVLPPTVFHAAISGLESSVIIFDPLSRFSVPRLASVMASHMYSALQARGGNALHEEEGMKREVKAAVQRALLHVHLFRPQSFASLLATLRSLPEYLFDPSRHESSHRRIHSIILVDIDAFYWPIRSTSTTANVGGTTASNPLTTASAKLTRELDKLSNLLSCATVLTSSSATPLAFRAPIPVSWPQHMNVTRLAVGRVEVAKYPPGISIEEAEAERVQRWDVVRKARFKCWKVGAGMQDGEGFVFRVGKGVEIEREESI